jgi:hypothetical protein
MQKRDFQRWTAQKVGAFEEVIDLKLVLRPYLEKISHDILETVFKIAPSLPQAIKHQWVLQRPLSSRVEEAIDADVWEKAIAPLLQPPSS